jgi:hypothetical protein
MCRASLRRALAPLAALALFATVALPAPPALASRPRLAVTRVPAQRVRHVRVSGTVVGVTENANGTGMLDIHSKTHATTYHVALTSKTVVKMHKRPVHRTMLIPNKNQSVAQSIAPCSYRTRISP